GTNKHQRSRFAFLVPKLCLGTPVRETLFRGCPVRETEFRTLAFPNRVWEREQSRGQQQRTIPEGTHTGAVDSSCQLCRIAYRRPFGQDGPRRGVGGRPRGSSPMLRSLRRCCLLLLAAGPCLLAGCFGVLQNPSYFPFLFPPGNITPPHANPPGLGYYANFDPPAIRLEVRPLTAPPPVQTQHVLIATVYDEKGQPRRNRRVEWLVEGV